MAKQKIVVKVTMKNNKKSRKAMQIAVSISGVESVSLDKEQIAVIGERVDSVQLTCKLRRCVGHTELVSVGPVEEKKPPKPPSTTTTTTTATTSTQKETVRCVCVCPEYAVPCRCPYAVPLQVVHEVPSNTCSIL
ncbi:hypothetical protein L6452_00567 [Arctium lappa]|uniref:Uncharacterized protein n=1 Tax=Arctium lappa TaxID=4217 RepID=A0ACB9FDS0_ARCLA|nr:hypothetical protein L6452_00567 [Arctium lappa]